MHVASGFTRADDGTRLWFRRMGPADAPPDAPALVLSNGASCTLHYWPMIAEHFARRLPIVQWDYRGHGLSQRDIDPETVSVPRFAKDLGAVLDAAGVTQGVLCGHSLGVQVVLEAAHRFPDRTAAVVAMFGTYGDPHRVIANSESVRRAAARGFGALGRWLHAYKPWVETLWESNVTTYLASLVGANRRLLPGGYLEQLIAHGRTMDPRVSMNCFRAALRYSAREILPQIDAPLLAFAGGQDRMTPAARAFEMCELAARGQVCLIPHASHLGLIEDPASVHYRLELFLQELGVLPAGPKAAPPAELTEREARAGEHVVRTRPDRARQPSAAHA
jgi:pimeloyl-ACP methyl ester carboxylesterase